MKKDIKIALDLDQCVFDFEAAYKEKYGHDLYDDSNEVITANVKQCKYDRNFWVNLPLLETPNFEPIIYATKRINPKSYTRDCLKKYNLPIKPIYQIYSQADNKARIIKGKCDVLIDDSWFNVLQCLEAGLPALLITRPCNMHIKTKYRVNNLNYEEIKQKYNELF